MKVFLHFTFFIILILLASCSESFKTLNVNPFNKKIANRTDIETPEELIRLFYNYPKTEETPKIIIKVENFDNNKFKITLVHEGLEDDSQSGEQIIMTANKVGLSWNVTEIKENWKCYGHFSWGITPCD